MAFQNPYAFRLQEFASFAFNNDDIYRFHRESGSGWRDFFTPRMRARPEKLIFEIGCSNATFLSQIAQANPNTAFVGMDWKYKVLYKGAKRIEQEKIQNLSLLRGVAQDVAQVFAPEELDEIWIFFPDPWAKKGQLKHRLIREEFLMKAQRCLKPGGRIYFKTDHPGYFQWVLALFGEEQPVLPDYEATDPVERSYKGRQVKVRKLETDDLPSPSPLVQEKFKIKFKSINYWPEQGTRVEREQPIPMFENSKTLFEEGFVRDGLPIYYVEIQKQ